MTTEFQTLELDIIVSSLTNPRKTFNADRLTELANSIKSNGVHAPILVRPLPAARLMDTFHSRGDGKPLPTHEIVAGERRYRASALAGCSTIPALVRDLSDEQVLEIQIVENLQRDDLTELEEAEGYEALMRHSGLTVDQVASKISKSRSYVYKRIKLLDLSLECKDALRIGQIDATRALLIARIPDTALQTKALAEATRANYRGDVCSVRDLQTWLQANVMLRLDFAAFKITDARLVPAAGSCKDCPKRTGANPDLFTDVQGADICTDPACFNKKAAAHRDVLVARAEAKGMRVIDGAEAKVLFPHKYIDRPKGYSALSQMREDVADGEPRTLGKLLGKSDLAAVLIENPYTKELIEAVPTDEAEAMLLARGLVQAVSNKSKSRTRDPESDLEDLKKAAARATEIHMRDAVYKELVNHIRQTTDQQAIGLIGNDLMRAWMLWNVGEIDEEDMAASFGIALKEDSDYDESLKQLRLHIQACSSADLFRALAIQIIMDDRQVGHFIAPTTSLFDAFASEREIDVTSIKTKADAEVKAKYAEEMKKIKAELKPKKADIPPVSLAQPKHADGKARTKTKTPALRKPKLSAEEAKQGIAEAMQGMEQAATAPPESEGEDADDEPTTAPATVKRLGPAPVKYRGPNGETWSGRGLMPKWLAVLIAGGGSKDKYLVREVAI